MNIFLTLLFVSSLSFAQEQNGSDAFKAKQIEVDEANKKFLENKNEIQKASEELAKKEREILQTKIRLQNIKRDLDAEAAVKKQLDDGERINKESIYVEKDGYFLEADANDPKLFTVSKADNSLICLSGPVQCFSYKIENGKKVLLLNRDEIKKEMVVLKDAKRSYQLLSVENEAKKVLIEQKINVLNLKSKFYEDKLEKKKKELMALDKSERPAKQEAAVSNNTVVETPESPVAVVREEPVHMVPIMLQRLPASDLEDQEIILPPKAELAPTPVAPAFMTPIMNRLPDSIDEDEPELKLQEKCEADKDECQDEVVNEVKMESKDELCQKEAIAKILELFKDDKKNILGKQFNLTALKTALYLKGRAGPAATSWESAVNKDQESLTKNDKISELKKIYSEHGVEGSAGIDEMVEKMKKGKFNYFSMKSRMSNEEASRLYLLLSKSESSVKFGMEDAAISWAMGQMNKFEKGSAAHNKLSMSSQVNKLMGVTIAGGTNMSKEELQKTSMGLEREIDDAIEAAIREISKECAEVFESKCDLIGNVKQAAFADLMKSIVNQPSDKDVKKYHAEVKEFIGKAGKEDFIELGKKFTIKSASQPTLQSEEKVQIAAGKTLMYQKPQSVEVNGACYETTLVGGKVSVSMPVTCK